MTQEEMQTIRAMMEEVTQASEKRMDKMMDEKLAAQEKRTDEKLAGITERLDAMQEDIAEIKEDVAITRSATNSLVEWADEVAVITQIKFPTKKAK